MFSPALQADFDIYSDAFKDANGFRPRGALADAFLALDSAGRAEALERMDEGWRLATAAEAAGVAAFRVKVTALGLDPDKYMHLA